MKKTTKLILVPHVLQQQDVDLSMKTKAQDIVAGMVQAIASAINFLPNCTDALPLSWFFKIFGS